jgi:microsomal epoxide hydrolase
MSATPEPFRLEVDEAAIADLRERLARTRFPDQAPGEPWAYGTDLDYLRGLVAYWRDGFDWRAQEAALNAFPQYKLPLGGIDLHFLHVPGNGPAPRPLLLLHGWPGSVFEFLDLIPRLADPARFGGDAQDARSRSSRRHCPATPSPSRRDRSGSASRRSPISWPS